MHYAEVIIIALHAGVVHRGLWSTTHLEGLCCEPAWAGGAHDCR